jgi:Tfp pilus assembly protein FimV
VPKVVVVRSVSIPVAQRATPDDRIHTVRPGESLWSIATDLLGADASTSQVAAEVQRLWARNSARIGTGDPDMLHVGTKLILTSREG